MVVVFKWERKWTTGKLFLLLPLEIVSDPACLILISDPDSLKDKVREAQNSFACKLLIKQTERSDYSFMVHKNFHLYLLLLLLTVLSLNHAILLPFQSFCRSGVQAWFSWVLCKATIEVLVELRSHMRLKLHGIPFCCFTMIYWTSLRLTSI